MAQPRHPEFAAFLDVVMADQPAQPMLRRPDDEKARLLAHGVRMLELEGLTAHLDDRQPGDCHLLFKTWRDTGYARLSITELATSYFLTAHDPCEKPILSAIEVPFSRGVDPLMTVLQTFVDWAVEHTANTQPDLSRAPRSRLPDPDGMFGIYTRRRLARKLPGGDNGGP